MQVTNLIMRHRAVILNVTLLQDYWEPSRLVDTGRRLEELQNAVPGNTFARTLGTANITTITINKTPTGTATAIAIATTFSSLSLLH